MSTDWSPALIAQGLGVIETDAGRVQVCVDRYDDGSLTIQTRKPGGRWGEAVPLEPADIRPLVGRTSR